MRFPADGEYVFPGALATLVGRGRRRPARRAERLGPATRSSSAARRGRRRPRRARRVGATRPPHRRASAMGRGSAATRRSSAARRWRNEPSKRDCLRSGSKRIPRDGHSVGQRADAAARHPREADRRAEVEERLQRIRPERVAGALLDPRHVRVDGQHRLAEGLVANRGRRVRPDARQLGQVVRPAVGGDRARGAVEVQRAPVVAEALPCADRVGGRRRRERLRPSASARATRASGARPARPASAAASPPRRGSRTDRSSSATAGRARARRTRPAAARPRGGD